MIAHTTGEVLRSITLPIYTGRLRSAFIDSKELPWLYQWLVEKEIAIPTHRCLLKDNFSYEEFKFRKDI